jgi:Bacterial Ig domain/Lactonase, 7-bladed beta-propeller
MGAKLVGAIIAVVACLAFPIGAFGATGDLAYDGCLGGNGCTVISSSSSPEPTLPTSIAVSPDGKSAYMTASGPDVVEEFTRTPSTSALTFAGCIGMTSPCTATVAAPDAVEGASSVVVSPNGQYVYVAGEGASSVAVFSRNTTTGLLSFDSCIGLDSDGDCQVPAFASTDGDVLSSPPAIAVSGDGKFVYVGTSSDEIDVLAVNGSNLTFASCLGGDTGCTSLPSGYSGSAVNGVDSFAMSPNGDYLYSVGRDREVIASFSRNPSSGALSLDACIDSPDQVIAGCTALANPAPNYLESIAISPDGRFLYVPSFNPASVIELAVSGGTMTLSGCAGEDSGCAPTSPTDALSSADAVAVSGDGDNVYVGSGSGIVDFARDASTGALTQAGCFAYNPPCAVGSDKDATESSTFLTVAPDGASVYSTQLGDSDVVEFSRAVPPIVCTASSGSTRYETAVSVPISCSDPEGLPLTYSIVSNPAHGTATLSGAAVDYKPASGYSGTDTLTIDASDFEETSNLATVLVTVAKAPPATQTKSVTIGAEFVSATAPADANSACVASPKKLSVSIKAKPLHGGFPVKFVSASLYLDKGVKKTTRKHGHKVVSYVANSTVHRLPATTSLSVSGVKRGSHTLTIDLVYTRIERKHKHKVTGKIRLEIDVC